MRRNTFYSMLVVLALVLMAVGVLLHYAEAAVTNVTKLNSEFKALNGQSQRFAVAAITFDSSYPTGGESLTAATYNMTRIEAVVKIYDDDKYMYNFDVPNQKLMVLNFNYDASDGPAQEIGNGTDLSGLNGRFLLIGR